MCRTRGSQRAAAYMQARAHSQAKRASAAIASSPSTETHGGRNRLSMALSLAPSASVRDMERRVRGLAVGAKAAGISAMAQTAAQGRDTAAEVGRRVSASLRAAANNGLVVGGVAGGLRRGGLGVSPRIGH